MLSELSDLKISSCRNLIITKIEIALWCFMIFLWFYFYFHILINFHDFA